MGLFSKKCTYEGYQKKIDKGTGVTRSVSVPGWKGKYDKQFCCISCANSYEQGNKTHCKSGKGGSCCG